MNAPKSHDWLVFVALLPCIGIAVLALFVVPNFREMYEQFGAMLPVPTTWLFASYRWLGLTCLVPIAVWAAWPNRASRGAAAVVVASLLGALLAIGGAFALYLPLMTLAAKV